MPEATEQPTKADPLLTTSQAAELLGLRPQTLHDWRCRGTGPPYFRLGRAVRYDRNDLLAWLDEQRVQTG